ncbi:hypothetical protein DICVIV_03120 [Dictyocaulus viviparus]|uniref:Uncharacterized protein n=1 Tax=Dictyocaulus viviparus TaxID=29172 RepID=A0A0D8Y1R0_DICVI|nr:hypothetical protein DICVIV_03120 [Dictyocaulus viviparus]
MSAVNESVRFCLSSIKPPKAILCILSGLAFLSSKGECRSTGCTTLSFCDINHHMIKIDESSRIIRRVMTLRVYTSVRPPSLCIARNERVNIASLIDG